MNIRRYGMHCLQWMLSKASNHLCTRMGPKLKIARISTYLIDFDHVCDDKNELTAAEIYRSSQISTGTWVNSRGPEIIASCPPHKVFEPDTESTVQSKPKSKSRCKAKAKPKHKSKSNSKSKPKPKPKRFGLLPAEWMDMKYQSYASLFDRATRLARLYGRKYELSGDSWAFWNLRVRNTGLVLHGSLESDTQFKRSWQPALKMPHIEKTGDFTFSQNLFLENN